MEKFLLFIGVFLIAIAIGSSGVLGSGDRIRANYTEESSKDRQSRLKLAGTLFLIGLACLGLRYLVIS